MASALGEINLLLSFILQDKTRGFLDRCGFFLNEGDYTLEEGSIGFCFSDDLLLGLWLGSMLYDCFGRVGECLQLSSYRLSFYLLSANVGAVKQVLVLLERIG